MMHRGDAQAELPIDKDGRLYHLGLKAGEVSSLVITVGDENRAQAIAMLFDKAVIRDSVSTPSSVQSSASAHSTVLVNIENVFGYRSSRGFLAYTGKFNGLSISVIAIGMGYPNMDFLVRELRAITKGPLILVRVGTCGCISEDGRIGMLGVPREGAIMVQRNYDFPFSFENSSMATLCDDEVAMPYRISRLYEPHSLLTKALMDATEKLFGPGHLLLGCNATSDSFYSSQGRSSAFFTDCNDKLLEELRSRKVTTVEMETAQLFHLASCIRDASGPIWASAVHIVVANRPKNEFLIDPIQRLYLDEKAASVALAAITSVAKNAGITPIVSV